MKEREKKGKKERDAKGGDKEKGRKKEGERQREGAIKGREKTTVNETPDNEEKLQLD